MKYTNNIERAIKNLCFMKKSTVKTTAELDKRIINDALLAQEKLGKAQSVAPQLSIWRTIMKSKVMRLAAAVVIIAMVIGIFQLDRTSVAFGNVKAAVRTSLSRLREFVAGMKEKQSIPSSSNTRTRRSNVNRVSSDIQYKHILVNAHVLSIGGEQENLRDFFDREDIKLAPVRSNPNTWYAKLDLDKAERFTEFAHTNDELKHQSSPSLLLQEGKEGVLIVSNGAEHVALALVATVLEDSKDIELSFSFLLNYSGFEIPSLRVRVDEAVLFRLVTTEANKDRANDENNPDRENRIFVLIRTKVKSPT